MHVLRTRKASRHWRNGARARGPGALTGTAAGTETCIIRTVRVTATLGDAGMPIGTEPLAASAAAFFAAQAPGVRGAGSGASAAAFLAAHAAAAAASAAKGDDQVTRRCSEL